MEPPEDQAQRHAPRRTDDSEFAPARGLQAALKNAGPAVAASYTLIGAIVLLGGLGYLADRWLETSPWLLVLGLLLGIVVGFYELARLVWRR